MYLYEVWVGTPKYHGASPLTYSCEKALTLGTIVEVPLKNTSVFGFVAKKYSPKPKFTPKPIQRFFENLILPQPQRDLHAWLLKYYPAPSGVITQLFIPNEIPKKFESSDPKITDKPLFQPQDITLTTQQKQAIDKIYKPQSVVTSLLHGETGSGKTQVYIELTKKVLQNGQSAIILTPEIGLTPQLLASFRAVFGPRIVITHSQLTNAVRRDVWLKLAQSDQPMVVIGPRSALFSPLKNIGLIVLDEAHDNSYKQDQSPYYQAQRIAAKLANLSGARCVLGTATPRVSDYYSLSEHNAPIVRMDKPINDQIVPPTIKLIDRKDKKAFTKSYLFSDELLTAIQKAIDQQEQVLLFLNRRGTARLVVCESCGWQAQCPDCEIPLIYHKDQHLLRCHTCGFSQKPVTSCEECKNTEITFQAAGAKALEEELKQLFNEANIMRFDSDTPSKLTLHKQYETINSGEVDILVGTQMLAKGLHLPRLTLVGIPFADSSLYLPDFTAEEQTYQLLTQVMGRVGRTSKQSRVIIQSYNPQNPTVQAAINRNWPLFYKSQIKAREIHKLPPFYNLLHLTCSRKTDSGSQKTAAKLVNSLTNEYKNICVLGPSPAFRHKSQSGYRWQVVVKSKNRQTLTKIIQTLPSGWQYNLDPINLL